MSEKRWLAAYVRMHHEKRVRERLTAMDIKNFLPVQEEIRQWSDRKKKMERILIPMMIFVCVDATERRMVISHPSVLRFLTLRGEHSPAEIPDEQMERFQFMLDHSESDINFNTENMHPGEKVRVVKGSLAGLEGELIMVEGKSRIAIRIHQLGCAEVEMNASMVEKI